jgi:hypothetical protein
VSQIKGHLLFVQPPSNHSKTTIEDSNLSTASPYPSFFILYQFISQKEVSSIVLRFITEVLNLRQLLVIFCVHMLQLLAVPGINDLANETAALGATCALNLRWFLSVWPVLLLSRLRSSFSPV